MVTAKRCNFIARGWAKGSDSLTGSGERTVKAERWMPCVPCVEPQGASLDAAQLKQVSVYSDNATIEINLVP